MELQAEANCSICYEAELLRNTPCNHTICDNCSKRIQAGNNLRCPLCRANIESWLADEIGLPKSLPKLRPALIYEIQQISYRKLYKEIKIEFNRIFESHMRILFNRENFLNLTRKHQMKIDKIINHLERFNNINNKDATFLIKKFHKLNVSQMQRIHHILFRINSNSVLRNLEALCLMTSPYFDVINNISQNYVADSCVRCSILNRIEFNMEVVLESNLLQNIYITNDLINNLESLYLTIINQISQQ